MTSILPVPPPRGLRIASALAVFGIALAVYLATLLPGLDFGDTGSYQAAVGRWNVTPRQAYPLYFAIANSLHAVIGGTPAWSLNVCSALAAALACAVMVWVASGVTGSLVAGVSAGLLLAGSYTFWSQAIIGEVYALHLLITGLVLSALLWWSRKPSLARLAVVFGLYALGFGNHLMMILLAPALVAFIAATPGGARLLFSRTGLALAAACALAGASQYLWNASYLWRVEDPRPGLADAIRTFWFDVTKSDWRATMVLGVHETALKRRLGLYWFDLRQQVGLLGVAVALLGIGALARRRALAVLVVTGYLVALAFAYTYNVGDVHVFFLPSHQMLALACAAGLAALIELAARLPRPMRRLGWILAVTFACGWPLWRIYDTWPAVDRHDDSRPLTWLADQTRGLDHRSLLVADINWQLENGLEYYTRHERPDLNVVRGVDAMLVLPFLVRDNLAMGRQVVVTPQSREQLEGAYDGLFLFRPDPRVDARPLAARLQAFPAATAYVIALLAPYPDLPFDQTELDAAAHWLTGGAAKLVPGPSYQVLAGGIGQRPTLERRDTLPFRTSAALAGLDVDIRMESWLPADTMRRAGFGHVITKRRHVLTLERGVSVVLFDASGRPVFASYASGLFAPLKRSSVTLAGLIGAP